MEKLEYNQIGSSQRLGFKLIVSAIDTDLHQEFLKAFDGFPEVEVVFQRFEDTDFDCVVSAANSFGLMDGGVDQCITDYFGVQMMHHVQSRIIGQFAGEQPIGTSIIVPGLTDEMVGTEKRFDRVKYVAHTPTMRVPRDVCGTDNAYATMKASLLAVKAHNHTVDTFPKELQLFPKMYRINSVVTTGLATLAGRMPFDKVAKQMALATYHVMNPPKMIDWYFASERDAQIQESR